MRVLPGINNSGDLHKLSGDLEKEALLGGVRAFFSGAARAIRSGQGLGISRGLQAAGRMRKGTALGRGAGKAQAAAAAPLRARATTGAAAGRGAMGPVKGKAAPAATARKPLGATTAPVPPPPPSPATIAGAPLLKKSPISAKPPRGTLAPITKRPPVQPVGAKPGATGKGLPPWAVPAMGGFMAGQVVG